MAMDRKSKSLNETYLEGVALLKTLNLLHAAELTEAARTGSAGEMATGSTSRIKPPSTEALQDFYVNDNCDPEKSGHRDPEQPANRSLEEDHIIREDAVPVSARFTTAGGRDWRDEALDEVRSAVLIHMQPDDAVGLEQDNVLTEKINDSTFGFQIGIAVRKVCDQLTFEKTKRMSLLESVGRQEEEIKHLRAENQELQHKLLESFIVRRPKRPLGDCKWSNSFRILAINDPGNTAITTHQYREGLVDPKPLDVKKNYQPADKHPEHVEGYVQSTDSPKFPRSLKRKRTTRPGMQTTAKSASEVLAINHLSNEEKKLQEARQFLLTEVDVANSTS